MTDTQLDNGLSLFDFDDTDPEEPDVGEAELDAEPSVELQAEVEAAEFVEIEQEAGTDDVQPITVELAPAVTSKSDVVQLEVPAEHQSPVASEEPAANGWKLFGAKTTDQNALFDWDAYEAAFGEGAVAPFGNDAILDAAFTYARTHGFPYRHVSVPIGMQEINRLAAMGGRELLTSVLGYQLADTYHPERFAVTVPGKKTPLAAFCDDKLLKRAILIASADGAAVTPTSLCSALAITSGVQAAANFRPGFALYLYKRFAPHGAVVLDTSTGYGGRLVGFLASSASRYIGVDPNTVTHRGNLRLAVDYLASDRVELINLPAEDVPHELLKGRCDFAFTSPPYFQKEHYSDEETQSCNRYDSGDAWRVGFLRPMLELQFAALRAGSHNVVNIADVIIGPKTYPLVEWTLADALAIGFDVIDVEEFPISRMPGQGERPQKFEPVVVMRKPEAG